MEKSKAKYAIIDTGTSLIYLPKTDYEKFIAKLSHIEELDCNMEKYDFCVSKYHRCDELYDKLDNFTVVLDNVWYSIPPEGYTLEDVKNGIKCMIAISHVPDSKLLVLLGDTFSRNFYTSFDYD